MGGLGTYITRSMSPLEGFVLVVTLLVAVRALGLARLAWRERRWANDAANDVSEGEYAVAMWRFDNNLVKLVVVWCCFGIALYSALIVPAPSRPLIEGDLIPQLRRIGTVLVPLLIVAPSLVVAWANERAYRWRRDQNLYFLKLRRAAETREAMEARELQAQRDQGDRIEAALAVNTALTRSADARAGAAAERSDDAHHEAREANAKLTGLGEGLTDGRAEDQAEVVHIRETTDATRLVAEETHALLSPEAAPESPAGPREDVG